MTGASGGRRVAVIMEGNVDTDGGIDPGVLQVKLKALCIRGGTHEFKGIPRIQRILANG